jgi:hypothetical protein
VREEIAASLRARPATLWPAGMPAQVLRVLQHADEVEAILSAASVDEPGGALSASAATARRDALRPIETAVRVARRAAVAEAVRVLGPAPWSDPPAHPRRSATCSGGRRGRRDQLMRRRLGDSGGGTGATGLPCSSPSVLPDSIALR